MAAWSIHMSTDPQLLPNMKNVSAVILAGGRGARFGGRDKGLVELAGRPLIAHVIEHLSASHVGQIIISANRNRTVYERFGLPVVSDSDANYSGPLSGIAAAMQVATTDYLFTCSCDAPFLQPGLSAHLLANLGQHETAVAQDHQRLQPTFSLLSCQLLDSLHAFIAKGDGKILRWHQTHNWCSVDCTGYSQSFININTPEDLAQAEARIQHETTNA